jgi:hypothetical protein
MAAGLTLVAAVLSVSGTLPALAQGAVKPFMALIVNDSEHPVPVSVPAPKLHASAEGVTGTDPVTLPPGIVFTDFVFSSGDPDCTVVQIGLFPNPGGAAPLTLHRSGERTTALHLVSGVRSPAENPLTIAVPVNCSATVFWSGYEG